MALALSKTTIESQLTTRFGDVFKLTERRFEETISTGIVEVDSLTNGLPRGAITEIFGPASSGRTSLRVSRFENQIKARISASSQTRRRLGCE